MLRAREVLGYFLFALSLLLAARWIQEQRLWDSVANYTLPWLCSAVAVGLVILGTMCIVCRATPATLPRRVAWITVVGVLLVFGTGMIVDYFTYSHVREIEAAIGEWVGFAAILTLLFVLPRMAQRARMGGQDKT